MFFIHGDADGVRIEHIAEMFSLKGGGNSGDLGPRSASRVTILPDTTHVALMSRGRAKATGALSEPTDGIEELVYVFDTSSG